MGDELRVKVLLLEDDRAPAEAVAASLAQRGLVVVGVVRSVEEVLNRCEGERPDVIVADIDYGHYSAVAIDAGGRLALNLPSLLADDGPPILWWSGHGGRHRLPAAIAGGAGFVDKREGLDELIDAIHRVAQGDETWLQSDRRAVRNAPKPPTARQLAVLRVIAAGATNKEAAAHLGIAERTVEKHLQDMYNKYRAGNRLGLVDLARMSDWIF